MNVDHLFIAENSPSLLEKDFPAPRLYATPKFFQINLNHKFLSIRLTNYNCDGIP